MLALWLLIQSMAYNLYKPILRTLKAIVDSISSNAMDSSQQKQTISGGQLIILWIALWLLIAYKPVITLEAISYYMNYWLR